VEKEIILFLYLYIVLYFVKADMKLDSCSNYSHYEIQSHFLHRDKMFLFFSVCEEVNGGRSFFIDRS